MNTILLRSTAILALLACMQAGANAAKMPAGPKRSSFAAFIEKLRVEGVDNFIRPNIAPFHALPPHAPTKAYIVAELPLRADEKPEKVFNLVMENSVEVSTPTPVCVVLIDALTGDTKSNSYHFKVGLDGTLLSAIHLTGKISEGKAIRGSGVKHNLDISTPDVKARFKKELDYWLSGRFRADMKPEADAAAPKGP